MSKQGQAIVYLADGDAHILPDIICAHTGCLMAFDSRTSSWAEQASKIRGRDMWRFGNCPQHQ